MAIMKAGTPFSFQLFAGQMTLPGQGGIFGQNASIPLGGSSRGLFSSEISSFTLAGFSPSPLAGALKGKSSLAQLYHRPERELEESARSLLLSSAMETERGPEPLLAELHLDPPVEGAIRAAPVEREMSLSCASSVDIGGEITALQSKNWSIRLWAVRALAKTDDARAVLPLLQAMGDADDDVRTIAAHALREFSPKRVIVPLIRAFGHADVDMREHAAQVILSFGRVAVDPLIAALGEKNQHVRARAALVLGGIGDARAVKPLIRALHMDTNTEVRRNAAEALGRLGNGRALATLLMAVEDRNVAVRAAAVDALGELGDVNAIVVLIRALEDKNATVRENAAWALGELGDKRAVDALLRAWKRNKKANVRAGIAKALGELGDVRAMGTLIKALSDRSKTVRSFAAEAIEALGSTVIAQGHPIRALQGEEERVRLIAAAFQSGMESSALDALVARGDPKDIAPFAELLGRLQKPQKLCEALAYMEKQGHPAVMPAVQKRIMALPRFEQRTLLRYLGSRFDDLLFAE